MLANYARIVRRSAAVTAIAAVIMLAICLAVGGAKGLIGGLVAVAVVALFFGISIVAVGRAARVSPQIMMATALGTYFAKVLALLILAGQFQDTTAFSHGLFGLTAVVCVLVYSGAQVAWSMRLKQLYVEPDGQR
jgi:ATP synthase protein I